VSSFKVDNFTEFKSLYNFNTRAELLNKSRFSLTPIHKSIKKADILSFFKVYISTNSFNYRYFLETHNSWKSFYIYNSKSGTSILNLNKIFLKWKNFYYLFYNLLYYNIDIVIFGTSFFKKELLSINWNIFSNVTSMW